MNSIPVINIIYDLNSVGVGPSTICETNYIRHNIVSDTIYFATANTFCFFFFLSKGKGTC